MDGPNLYQYVSGNPVRLHDPSGMNETDSQALSNSDDNNGNADSKQASDKGYTEHINENGELEFESEVHGGRDGDDPYLGDAVFTGTEEQLVGPTTEAPDQGLWSPVEEELKQTTNMIFEVIPALHNIGIEDTQHKSSTQKGRNERNGLAIKVDASCTKQKQFAGMCKGGHNWALGEAPLGPNSLVTIGASTTFGGGLLVQGVKTVAPVVQAKTLYTIGTATTVMMPATRVVNSVVSRISNSIARTGNTIKYSAINLIDKIDKTAPGTWNNVDKIANTTEKILTHPGTVAAIERTQTIVNGWTNPNAAPNLSCVKDAGMYWAGYTAHAVTDYIGLTKD